MTKGHGFVKNMTIKNPKSHAHLQIMAKHSAKFQFNSIKDVARVAGTRMESERAVTPQKTTETKIKNHMHNIIRKQCTKFQINPTKDVGGVAGTRFWKDGQTEGRTHTRTNEGHFYSPPPPPSGDNNYFMEVASVQPLYEICRF